MFYLYHIFLKCRLGYLIVSSIVADPDPSDPYVLGLLDPDPNPLVRGTDPDPENSKLPYCCFPLWCGGFQYLSPHTDPSPTKTKP